MAEAHPSGPAGASSAGSHPRAYLERTTGKHQQGAAWTFFPTSTRAYAAGCDPGAYSQHRWRGLRRPCGAQRHASPGSLSRRTFCCALFDCARPETGNASRSHAAITAGGTRDRNCTRSATGLLHLSREAIHRRACLRALVFRRRLVEAYPLVARAMGPGRQGS